VLLVFFLYQKFNDAIADRIATMASVTHKAVFAFLTQRRSVIARRTSQYTQQFLTQRHRFLPSRTYSLVF